MASSSSSDYAHHPLLHQCPLPPQDSRLAGLRGAGQILEVHGGHIVRSTGLKDRHSKVCTARGLRDRRVRLSAYTAIKFYDVQDRLGYDRPSKAVDWLMKHAKAAIDELDQLPPWRPSASTNPPPSSSDQPDVPDPAATPSPAYDFGCGGACLLPPSLDSDAIADTIKSFLPMAATTSSSSPPIAYQYYPPDLLSRTSSQAQDLRLSLQSFPDPVFHHHQIAAASAQQALFPGSAPLPFGATSASWSEQNQRVAPWNVAETSGGGSSSGAFNVPVPMQPVLGLSQFFTQRGPLQSNNSSWVRSWMDPIAAAATGHQLQPAASSTSVNPIGFAPCCVGDLSGFHIRARIDQGGEEQNGISDMPPSAPQH